MHDYFQDINNTPLVLSPTLRDILQLWTLMMYPRDSVSFVTDNTEVKCKQIYGKLERLFVFN